MADLSALRAVPEIAPEAVVWRSLADELRALQPAPTNAELAATHAAAVVVVGAGPSAQALVRLLSRRAPTRDVLVLNGERFVPYNRAQISSTLADGRPLQRLAAFPPAASDLAPKVLHDARVVAIDRTARAVQLHDGRVIRYDTLVLATGARSRRLPPLDVSHPRLRDFRSLDDLQVLAELMPRHVVVVGGGLLGIEAARAMQSRCPQVTVLERFPHLLPRQLDQEAAMRVAEQLQAQGVTVLCERKIAALDCQPSMLTLTLEDCTALRADLVISATGVEPESRLAADAGLTVDRGVVVDANFRTSDEHIYAIGECCEQDGQTFGSLAPCLTHAEHLSALLNGEPPAPAATSNVFQLKLAERTIVSIGNTRAVDQRVCAYSGSERAYRRIFLIEQRVVGAILYDRANTDISAFTSAVAEQRLLTPDAVAAFVQSGQLPETTSNAQQQIICFCANVSRGRLLDLQQQGLTRARIIASTGSSQHCGSCAGRIEQVLGGKASTYNVRMTGVALASVLLFCVVLLLSWQTPLADSWTSSYRQIDWLWRDPIARQITGYFLLLVALLSFAWGYWRRVQRLHERAQRARIGTHALTAAAALLLWLVHTGGRIGYGLNRWLLLTLLLVAITGALAGAAWLQAAQSPWQRRAATGLRVLHWFALLPVPALLLFHIVKTYYY